MATLNLCQFIGNVGKIETRFAPSGEAVTNISLACNETWKDKNTGEKKESVEWVRVSIFGKLAEIAQKYVVKGAPLYVAGKMKTRKWQAKEGHDVYTTEIIAHEMQMLGGRDDAQQSARPAPAAAAKAAPAKASTGFDEMDDDIPW
jgi:single-strand DNA-binding protein